MKFTDLTDMVGVTNTRSSASQAYSSRSNMRPEDYGKKKVLLSWEAKSRPEKKDMSDKITRSLMLIGIVISLILVILQEFFLILVIGSIVFISYVLSRVPPESAKYSVSTHGISIDGNNYYWYDFYRFFFTQQEGLDVLAVDMLEGAPARLFLTIDKGDKEKLKEILGEHLDYLEEEPKTVFNKTYEQVMDKFNI